jgi:hypothetical protein
MTDITFAALLTAAGAGIAAGIVTSAVSLIQNGIPFTARWNGATLAFIGSGVLYVLAAVATSVATLDAALGVFLAWLTCATAAVGIHKVIVNPIVGRIGTSS